jgi:DNA polymerase-1
VKHTSAPAGTLLEAALIYADMGWPVLPLYPIRDGRCACPESYKLEKRCKPAKHPIGDLVPNAHQDATTDAARIATWWSLWPDANVGVALGAAGLIDIAPDSIEWWAEFKAQGLPVTAHFASGGGDGHEHWLYQRGDLPSLRIARRGRFDILSDGYAVAPPSVHESGQPYRWIDWSDTAPRPDWLVDVLTEHAATQVADDADVVPADTDVPPINLFGEQFEIWSGNVQADDRSNGLVEIARMLCDAGYQDVEGIASILAERDSSLGWHKYTNRKDASRQYRAIAQRYGRPVPKARLQKNLFPVPGIGMGTAEQVGAAGQPPPGVEVRDPIKWRSHRQTVDLLPPDIDWWIDGILGRGLITELVAKVKMGKTTFMLQGLRAGIAGDEVYCGRAVRPFRVAYVTEEGWQTFQLAMRRYGLNDLIDNDAFFTVFDFETEEVNPKKPNLPFVIDSLIHHAIEDHVDVIILDTLSIIAGLDEEDDSGKAAAVMAEVRRLTTSGLAVGILRHSRKSGGDVGDAGRGSSAISGYCDILLQIEPFKGDEDTTSARVLRSKSRLGVYEPLMLEFDKATERYSSVGPAQSSQERLDAAVLEALEALKATSEETRRTSNEVTVKSGKRKQAVTNTLKELVADGRVARALHGQSVGYWLKQVINLTHEHAEKGVENVAEPVPEDDVSRARAHSPEGTEPPDASCSAVPISVGGTGTAEQPKREKTPAAVAKAAEKKAALELERLEAADAAAPTLQYLVPQSEEDLVMALKLLSTVQVALDTETTGLNAHRDTLRTIQLSDGKTNVVIDTWKVTGFSALQSYLDEVDQVAMHTYLFDLAFLAQHGISIDPSKIYDVRTAAMVLESKEDWTDFRLQGIAKRHLQEHVSKKEQKRGWDVPSLRHAKLAYAAEDARVTIAAAMAISDKLAQDADVDGLWNVLKLERDVQAATWWLASAGAPADREVMAEAVAEQEAEAAERLELLNKTAGVAGVNWRSPKQVLPILQARGLELEGTGEDALMDAETDDPLVDALLRYRSAGANLGLLRKAQGSIAADGRIYASFNPIGAQTGRTSCSDPNLQNLPRNTRAREAIRPPAGRVFVRADYSQLQIVIAAWIAQDEEMIRILNEPGGEVHQRTADAVGCTRDEAKAVNFGFLFGAGAETFRREQRKHGNIMSLQEAHRYRTLFMRTYRGIRAWHRGLSDWGVETTVIDPSGSGRRRSAIFSKNVKANTPVQMVEAHGFKRALQALYETRESVPSARLVMMVHDELIAECDASEAVATAHWLKQHMTYGMQPLVDGVTIRVDATIVPSYSDADKKLGQKVE